MSNTTSLSAPVLQTVPPEGETPWETWQILLLVIPLSIIIIEIILGNLLVILAVLTHQKLRTASNIIILSLAVADLSVGVFILPFNIAEMIVGWKFGKILCRFWLTFDVTLCSTSILHISAIAVDRFRSINEGLQYAQSRSIRMTLVVCGALWFVALWIASAPVLGWNDWKGDEIGDKIDCSLTRELGYIIHSATGAFFIPAAIMVALYFRIFLLIRNKLRDRSNIPCLSSSKSLPVDTDDDSSSVKHMPSVENLVEGDDFPSPRIKPKRSLSVTPSMRVAVAGRKCSEQIETILKTKLRFSLTKERKMAKTLGIIIGAFIVCWSPFTLTYLTCGIFTEMNKYRVADDQLQVSLLFFQIVTWLGYINCGLNPIIYTIYNQEFRQAFGDILKRLTCRT